MKFAILKILLLFFTIIRQFLCNIFLMIWWNPLCGTTAYFYIPSLGPKELHRRCFQVFHPQVKEFDDTTLMTFVNSVIFIIMDKSYFAIFEYILFINSIRIYLQTFMGKINKWNETEINNDIYEKILCMKWLFIDITESVMFDHSVS